MDEVIKKAGDIVLQSGMLGVIILALAFVAWRLFNLYTCALEKRIEDGKESTRVLEQNAVALENLSKVIDAKGK